MRSPIWPLSQIGPLISGLIGKLASRRGPLVDPKIADQASVVKASGLFDAGWYIDRNPDVAAAGVDPLVHYVQFGGFEGRDPNADFSSSAYLAAHPDLASAGKNPLFHAIVTRSAAVFDIYRRSGVSKACDHIRSEVVGRTEQGAAFEMLADHLCGRDRDAAPRIYRLAYDAHPHRERALALAAKIFRCGGIAAAADLLALASPEPVAVWSGELMLANRLRRDVPMPPRAGRLSSQQGPVAYVASGVLPYLSTGYAVRTHHLLRALRAASAPVACYARPGFPYDRPDLNAGAMPDPSAAGEFDGIEYIFSRTEPISHQPEQYIERVAQVLERRFRAQPPSVVQAASNHRNALPALIAARRVGAPFVYEVRGLWELTAASQHAGWERTERFALDRLLELTVAKAADRVLAITQSLAEELIAAGVAQDRIVHFPNAVDPEAFPPGPRDEARARELRLPPGAFTLVYCGSLNAYEGLDDLIAAAATLRRRGLDAWVVIVGDGAFRAQLEARIRSEGMTEHVRLLGRTPPQSVASYLSLADAVALPRKDHKVCRLISPLKPFEAMALGKPVVLSDLPALREIVIDRQTGRLCRPGDPAHLAEVLEELARDIGQRRALAEAGREWVLRNRTWTANATRLIDIHGELTDPP